MSTVKISELAPINLSANTGNTIFLGVDLPTLATGRLSGSDLAQGLYRNNSLVVGNNAILFPNTVAQFSGNSITYLQVNLQNFTSDGSSDFVATSDNGIDANGYINMGVNGSTFSDPNFSSMEANDGYLYVHGPFDNQPIGNLVIGTATTDAAIKFIIGGTKSENIVSYITSEGIHSPTIDTAIAANVAILAGVNLTQNAEILIIEGVNNTQNTRLDSIETVNIDQNTAISIIQGVDLTQNTNITTANNHAWAAFDKANNALANTTGTFAGDLTITGNTRLLNYVDVVNSNFDANTSLVHITASDNGVIVPPSNSYYMLHITGKSNNVTRVVIDSFGANTYPLISGRMGRGSASAPAAVANNDVMMRIVGNGYTGTRFAESSPTKIDFVASENFSETNRGTRIEFWNTPSGSNTIQKIANFNANTAEFIGTVNPQKGFIFNPRLPAGNQTALTIDFGNDSIIKANLVVDLNVTLTNYQFGKIVELWLVNTDAQNRTVTHGCSALNSTNKSTTYTITSGSSAYLRYFSIDGDNANTFVAIVP